MAEWAHLKHDAENPPSWGSLPLDPYMLDNWNPNADISDCDQRLQLVRSFLRSGTAGREVHELKVENAKAQCTDEQATRVLAPLRAPALRHVAYEMLQHTGEVVWLRTDYEHEDQHQALVDSLLNEVNFGENLYEDGMVVSDARFYSSLVSCQDILDVLPEIVERQHRNNGNITSSSYLQNRQREYVEWDREYYAGEHSSVGDSAENDSARFAEKTMSIHARCCSEPVFIEDRQTFEGEMRTFHAVWLDEQGTTVRESRPTLEDACEYLAGTTDAINWEHPCFMHARVGSDYARGGRFGPPYAV